MRLLVKLFLKKTSQWQVWVGMCCALCTFLSPAYAKKKGPQAEILLFPASCSLTHCTIEGRLVRKRTWSSYQTKPSKKRALYRAVKRFTRGGLSLATIELKLFGLKKTVRTNKRGFFEVRFAFTSAQQVALRKPSFSKRLRMGWGLAKHKLSMKDTGRSIVYAQLVYAVGRFPWYRRYYASQAIGIVTFPRSPRGISIISDIDDTLIATHVKKKGSLLKVFLFRRFDQIKVFPNALSFCDSFRIIPKVQGVGHFIMSLAHPRGSSIV